MRTSFEEVPFEVLRFAKGRAAALPIAVSFG